MRKHFGLAACIAVVVAVFQAVPAQAAIERMTTSHWIGLTAIATPGHPWQNVYTQFRVPTVECSKDRRDSVMLWAGMGGYFASTPLVQVGVSVNCRRSGKPSYRGFWEVYDRRTGSPEQIIKNYTVRPGDDVVASVESYTNDPSAFLLSISSIRAHSTYSDWTKVVHQNKAANTQSTAECIVEAPVDGRGITPLAQFSPDIGMSCFGNSDVAGGSFAIDSDFNVKLLDMQSEFGSGLAATTRIDGGKVIISWLHR